MTTAGKTANITAEIKRDENQEHGRNIFVAKFHSKKRRQRLPSNLRMEAANSNRDLQDSENGNTRRAKKVQEKYVEQINLKEAVKFSCRRTASGVN